MKWYAVSGSWRRTSPELERDVREVVTDIVGTGNGIITGGALGVDYLATETVINASRKPETQLKIYLPVPFQNYISHLQSRVEEGTIMDRQFYEILMQLSFIRRNCPEVITDDFGFTDVSKESYYARIDNIVKDCDELFAFHVNNSRGVQYSIDKAKEMGKKYSVRRYTIEELSSKV